MAQVRSRTDEVALAALEKWMNCSTNAADADLQTQRERLTSYRVGHEVDQQAGNLLSKTVKVKLLLPSGWPSENCTVFTYNSYIADVPGDGNCGFHALSLAARSLGGKTATGDDTRSTVTETRQQMVLFLQVNRELIERSLWQRVGTQAAQQIIWSDDWTPRQSKRRRMRRAHYLPTFNDFCASLTREGMSGHWLGSKLGEFEVHLLARSLGVMAFCVRAGVNLEKEFCLRQEGVPFSFLWENELAGTPNGAVVIRFIGPFTGGHFQVVRCGKFIDVPDIEPEKTTDEDDIAEHAPIRSIGLTDTLEKDILMVQQMHGVQSATKLRYKRDYELVDQAFSELLQKGCDPLQLEKNGLTVIKTIMSLLMRRCGPKSRGYEEKSANSTGKVLLASVSRWYKQHGYHFSNQQTCTVNGNAVYGPPWKAEQVLEFKDSLMKNQAKARTNPVKRAYQVTHDDIATAMREYVAKQLGDALHYQFTSGKSQKVDWLRLQTALMVVASFGSGCRGAEMVSLRIGDLRFYGDNVDTAVGAVLYGVKAKRGSKAVRKVLFPSWRETLIISPSHAILMQLVLVHGLHSDAQLKKARQCGLREQPLFPSVLNNQPQLGQFMSSDSYSAAVRDLFKSLAISDSATEHSPRRGAYGYRYYVLGENLDYIRDFLGHANLKETLTYIGFFDKKNSYVCQGFGTGGAGIFR